MQTGTVVRRGRFWYLRYYAPVLVNGKVSKRQRAVKLIEVSREYPDAQSVRDAGLTGSVLAPINTRTAKPGSTLLLADFLQHEYLVWIREHKKPSTLKNYNYRFQLLKPYLEGLELTKTRTSDINRLLESVAVTERAHTTLKHVKAFLSGAFRFAIGRDKFPEGWANPAHAADVPEGLEAGDGRHYSLEEVKAILKVVPEPAKTVVLVAALAGLRIGEIAGLMWSDIEGNELHVKRAIWRGRVGTVKTKKSRQPVPIIKTLKKALEAHRKRSVGEFIFSGEKSGRPQVMENLLARKILPALKEANIPWKGWHAFRRGLATNLSKLGIDILTISRLLRHANIAITEQSYAQPVPQNAQKAMREIDRAFGLAK